MEKSTLDFGLTQETTTPMSVKFRHDVEKVTESLSPNDVVHLTIGTWGSEFQQFPFQFHSQGGVSGKHDSQHRYFGFHIDPQIQISPWLITQSQNFESWIQFKSYPGLYAQDQIFIDHSLLIPILEKKAIVLIGIHNTPTLKIDNKEELLSLRNTYPNLSIYEGGCCQPYKFLHDEQTLSLLEGKLWHLNPNATTLDCDISIDGDGDGCRPPTYSYAQEKLKKERTLQYTEIIKYFVEKKQMDQKGIYHLYALVLRKNIYMEDENDFTNDDLSLLRELTEAIAQESKKFSCDDSFKYLEERVFTAMETFVGIKESEFLKDHMNP